MAKESSAERVSPITRANYLSNGSPDDQGHESEYDPLTALASMVGNIERDILANDPAQNENAQADMESELIEGLYEASPASPFGASDQREGVADIDPVELERSLSDALAGPDVLPQDSGVVGIFPNEDIYAQEQLQADEDQVQRSFEALNAEFNATLSSIEPATAETPTHSEASTAVRPAFSLDDEPAPIQPPLAETEEYENSAPASEGFGELFQPQAVAENTGFAEEHSPDGLEAAAEEVLHTDISLADAEPPVAATNIHDLEPQQIHATSHEVTTPPISEHFQDPIQAPYPEVAQSPEQPIEQPVENPAGDEYLDANIAAEFDTAMAGSFAEMVNATQEDNAEYVAESPDYIEAPASGVEPVAEFDEVSMPPVETPFDHQVDEALDTIIEDTPEEKAELGWTGDLAGELEGILAASNDEYDKALGVENSQNEQPAPHIVPSPDHNEVDFSSEFDVQGDNSAFEQDFANHMETATLEDPFMQEAQPEYAPERRGGMRTAAIVLGVAVLAGGGAFGWKYFATPASDGPAKIVMASSEPVKIKPKEPGGVEIPNQDQVVFDKVNGKSTAETEQTKLTSGIEKPIRVVPTFSVDPIAKSETATGASAKVADTAKSTERVAPGDTTDTINDTALISPRKVRTVVVRPDGTIVSAVKARPVKTTTITNMATKPIELPVAETPKSAAKTTTPKVVSVQPIEESVTSTGNIVPAKIDVAPLKVDPVPKLAVTAPKPVQPKVETVTPKPVTPKVAVAEAPKKTVKKVAKAAPAKSTPAKPVKKAATPVVTASTGSYGMQISSQRSAEAAQSSYNRLSRQFSSILGGRGVDIRRTELKGKGIYFRVRIPVGSKKSAINLCSKYKSAGGSCFVTR